MTRILPISLVMLGFMLGFAAAGIRGDLDQSGWVDGADNALLAEVISGGAWVPGEVEALGDIDSDGFLTVMDLMLLELLESEYYTEPRIRCLYNGYLLTVNPWTAVDPATTVDRSRFYVLHAVLIHPVTGRIIGIYPALPGEPGASRDLARPLDQYPELLTEEDPPAPGITATALIDYWRAQGIDEALLDAGDFVNLNGAVVTPGLMDDHLHISPWSKKIPAPGQRFGSQADVGDPAFYIDTATWERVCEREALWRMVAAVNQHLAEEGLDRKIMHGYWYGAVDEINPDPAAQAYMFSMGTGGAGCARNPDYILNRVGVGPGAPFVPPADPCTAEPSVWPPLDYPTAGAVLVHTSGQSCWYNTGTLDIYNARQEEVLATLFDPVPASGVSPPDAQRATWAITVTGLSPDINFLFNVPLPYSIDVVVVRQNPPETLYIPFSVVGRDFPSRTLYAQPILAELAATALAGPADSLTLVPFYRPIVSCISRTDWNAALAYWGESPGNIILDYGRWDPRQPHATNWYNGAQIGLLQYVYDTTAQVWRPSGYAEHYVMRDMLLGVINAGDSIAEMMTQRRQMVGWCLRHGLTSAHEIMFYRHRNNTGDYSAYQALSYDSRFLGEDSFFGDVGLEPGVRTGHLNFRIGMYYYLENPVDVSETLQLAHDPAAGSDVERLRPHPDHPEYPGWVRWLGWKLQLDGGTTSRTAFSNAPYVKTRQEDPFPTTDENGAAVTFWNHGFGLLTVTNVQEQSFTSRESAALYWLVRESDPIHPGHNPAITNDWSFLRNGVIGWLDRTVDPATLALDLDRLVHVDFAKSGGALEMAQKIATVDRQVTSARETLLQALATIWYARCTSDSTLPALPSQTVCHCVGDGAVDIWVNAIKQFKLDLESLPGTYAALPAYWRQAVPPEADLGRIQRFFHNERFRVEHLMTVSHQVYDDINGPGGINTGTAPAARNIAFSTQPLILAQDGQGLRATYPLAQELWDIPHQDDPNFWFGVAAKPRYHHLVPMALHLAADIPLTLNTDPPSMRDPRPAMTLIGAVARTPIEVDPSHWLDQTGPEPEFRPPDYLAGKVYTPSGLTQASPQNPMHLTMEQALASMTYWAAYVASQETELGAIAVPPAGSGEAGWFADLVVWTHNPMAIRGPTGLTLESLSQIPEGVNDPVRLETVNAFIEKFLPAMTIVGGLPAYQRPF